MTVCGGWSLVNLRKTPQRAITLRCRSWSCPDCGPLRERALKALARGGKPTKFLTLTIKDRECSVDEQALLLSDAFRKLIKRWRRHKPNDEIEFLAVFEPHPSSGRPHLHVILRAPFTQQAWLSKQMDDLLDSPIVDIRAITDRRRVAMYIAKYITKSNKRFGSAKRYWSSKRYDLSGFKKKRDYDEFGSGWQIYQQPLWSIAEEFGNYGVEVEWLSDTEWIIFCGGGT